MRWYEKGTKPLILALDFWLLDIFLNNIFIIKKLLGFTCSPLKCFKQAHGQDRTDK